VKQADKLLRSSGRPLDLYRNKIEAETLMLEARLIGFLIRLEKMEHIHGVPLHILRLH